YHSPEQQEKKEEEEDSLYEISVFNPFFEKSSQVAIDGSLVFEQCKSQRNQDRLFVNEEGKYVEVGDKW
ncbi:12938_t:CDS:2, partial [Entrophospora sp. SA101]